MASLVIRNNEYHLDDNLSLAKWVEMNNWKHLPVKFISVGMDIPLEEAKLIPEETQALACALLIAVMNPDWHKLKPTIQGHHLTTFQELTLGQFIDLENYTADYSKQMPNMVKVLYGIEDISDVKLNDVHGAIQSYLNWRTLLYKQYERLFDIGHDDDEDIEVKQKKNNTAHVWMDITMVLSGNDFTKMDYVLNQPLILALNWLAWNKDKQRAEAERLKKERLKNKR